MKDAMEATWSILVLAVLVLMWISVLPALSQNTFVPAKPPGKQTFILPPEKYDRWYEGDLTIMIVNDLEDLKAACGIPGNHYLACAFPRAKACLVVMVKDEIMRTRGWTTGLLLRHEIGHCNGWIEHDGQRALTDPSKHWVPVDERPRTRDGR